MRRLSTVVLTPPWLLAAALVFGCLVALRPFAVRAQTAGEPDYPACPAGTLEVLEFGPGLLSRPEALEAKYVFDIPAGVGPAGWVRVWQGEGHAWDAGCTEGPDNDGGVFPCDQNQTQEVITFTLNAQGIGQFVDHSPTGDDTSTLYEFGLDALAAGSNELGLHHLNQGEGSNSVFYKGVVCAEVKAEPLGEVGDYVWLDADEDGVQNDGGSAAGVAGVTVTLYNAADDSAVATVQTSATGGYLFSNLPAGSYYLVFDLPADHEFTVPDVGSDDEADSDANATGRTPTFVLAAGEINSSLDAGLIPEDHRAGTPGVAVIKYTNGEDANSPTGPVVRVGSTVTWTYEVQNTGEVPLRDVVVTDNIAGVTPVYVSGDANGDDLLDLTEVWLFRATGIATVGQYANVGTVTAGTSDGGAVTDDDPSHYFGIDPAIQIVKYTNGEDADETPGVLISAGEAVTWTYVVRNTGDVPLSDIVVTDNITGVLPVYMGGDTNGDQLLDLDEEWLYQALGTAIAGQYANIGTVVGTPPVGPDVTDGNPSHYFGDVVLPPTGLPVDEQTNQSRRIFLPALQRLD